MLLLKPIRTLQGRSVVRPQGLLPSYFHSALGFSTQTLAWTLDSLVRVSRRATCNHYASILRYTAGLSRRRRHVHLAITTEAYILNGLVAPLQLMLARPKPCLLASPSLPTISRTVSLSFQSAFHLSITVLVRYRSLANI